MDALFGRGDALAVSEGEVPGPPPLYLTAVEVPRAMLGMAQLPFAWAALGKEPSGDGRPVMLLPGLFNSDRSNIGLKAHLNRLGYDARSWGLGRNLGQRTIGHDGARLFAAIEKMAVRTGRPVTLVGVSLGGIMARIAARRLEGLVAGVVTISAPFAGPPTATNVWRAYQWVSGTRIDAPEVAALSAEAMQPLPVPSAAIWSASDGLVSGAICHAGDMDCIEVRSPHIWVQFNPQVLRGVARILGQWQ